LATYVKGLGLEDLKGCECAFSKSNALAGSIHYASVFHRMQAIAAYFAHNDTFEVYQNLSVFQSLVPFLPLIDFIYLATFLLNNYKQALDIVDSGSQALAWAMSGRGASVSAGLAEGT
jgi:hypothetical protein